MLKGKVAIVTGGTRGIGLAKMCIRDRAGAMAGSPAEQIPGERDLSLRSGDVVYSTNVLGSMAISIRAFLPFQRMNLSLRIYSRRRTSL